MQNNMNLDRAKQVYSDTKNMTGCKQWYHEVIIALGNELERTQAELDAVMERQPINCAADPLEQ